MVKDLSMIENPLRELREQQDELFLEELKSKGMLSVGFTKNADALWNTIQNGKQGYVVNITRFTHLFLNIYSLYAHPSLGGQWLYDENTGLWNDLDYLKMIMQVAFINSY